MPAMSNHSIEDDSDDEPTNELPMLVETALLDPALVDAALAAAMAPAGEGSDGQTVVFPLRGPGHAPSPDAERLREELAARGKEVQALQSEVSRLTARERDLESELEDKDSIVHGLVAKLEDLQRTADEHAAAEQRLAVEIADRDQQLNGLREQLDREYRAITEQRAALDAHVRRQDTLEIELAATRTQLAEESAKTQLYTPSDETASRLQAAQDELAALKGYVANRRARWEESEGLAKSNAKRIAELEHELKHREARQHTAEELAHGANERAESFRRDLVEASRNLAECERELAALRDTHALERLEVLERDLASAVELNTRLQTDLEKAASRERLAREDAAKRERAAREEAAVAARAADAAASERIAGLEAELASKGRELDALAEQSRAGTEQAERAIAELAQARSEHAATRAELKQLRDESAGLEHAVLERDRALAARDERLALLQQELGQWVEGRPAHAADQHAPHHELPADQEAEPPAADQEHPALVCLTGERPRQYALARPTMTIGRSTHCDIQVFTHFVSREHARLTVDPDRVVIEDLGSTNGVFVNSVRVERQELRHSDLVTVGETQFRFLDRMRTHADT